MVIKNEKYIGDAHREMRKESRHNSKGSHQITLKENKINRMELSMNYKMTHEQLTKSQQVHAYT